MLKWFICPDGERCEVDVCLSKCRLNKRCNPPSVLRLKSQQRDYPSNLEDYTPSVTELLNEPYQKLLYIKNDYAESPFEANWKVRGTAMHARIEAQDVLGVLAEQRYPMIINGRTITHGQYDAIDVEEGTLWDYKSLGSSRLGIMLSKPFEEGFYDYIWQLNAYAYIVRHNLPDLIIDRLALYTNTPDVIKSRYDEALYNWMTCREYVRGAKKGERYAEPIHPEYVFEIPMYSDEAVEKKFLELRERWDLCVKTDGASEQHRCKERWTDDRRCKTWCSVSKYCKYWRELRG